MIEGYTTVKDIAEKWNIKPRTVQIMCADGKIPGVVKFGATGLFRWTQRGHKMVDFRIIKVEKRGKYENNGTI